VSTVIAEWPAVSRIIAPAPGEVRIWTADLEPGASVIDRLVPLLILAATLLFAAQEVITRRLGTIARAHEKPTVRWVVFVFTFQFLVGIYGGYFGAAMGILMLAALGLIGLTDLHQMNGLKNVLAVCINGVAAIYFALAGAVVQQIRQWVQLHERRVPVSRAAEAGAG
jgi:uncharacterized membrane protein YfcA